MRRRPRRAAAPSSRRRPARPGHRAGGNDLRVAPPPPSAGVNTATGTSARSGTWWEHLRERASNGPPPGKPIMAREPEFKILKNTDGEYYWRLEAAGGRVAAWPGQAYAIKQACVNDAYWGQGQRIADHDLRLHRGVAARRAHNPQSPECPAATPGGRGIAARGAG